MWVTISHVCEHISLLCVCLTCRCLEHTRMVREHRGKEQHSLRCTVCERSSLTLLNYKMQCSSTACTSVQCREKRHFTILKYANKHLGQHQTSDSKFVWMHVWNPYELNVCLPQAFPQAFLQSMLLRMINVLSADTAFLGHIEYPVSIHSRCCTLSDGIEILTGSAIRKKKPFSSKCTRDSSYTIRIYLTFIF